MKHLIIPFLLVLLLSACSDSDKQAIVNIAIVEEYVKAVETKDYSTMELLLAENYMGYGPSFNDSTDRTAALESWKYNTEFLYESISYKRSQIAAVRIESGPNKGDWVANWAELQVEYLDGTSPVTIWANSNYRIENDKIVKSYTFYNEADVLNQLGYEFIPPQ